MNSLFQHSYSDIALIVLILILLAIGIILTIRERQKFKSYKKAYLIIFLGFSLLLFSTIGNSMVSERWDINYMIAFLSLIRLNDGIFFYRLVFCGYATLFLGITILIIVKVSRIKGKKSN